MIKLEWMDESYGMSAEVPAIEAGHAGHFKITATKRPPYCDRGSFLVQIWSHGVFALDDAEGFPRYYFSEDAMKTEMEAWVNKRQACIEAEPLESILNITESKNIIT